MEVWLDAVLVLLTLTCFWLLGSSRLQACIRAVALQGVLLGIVPLCTKWPHLTWRLAGVAVLSTVIKSLGLPLLLQRAVRLANVRNEVQPFVGFTTSLLLGIALWGAAMYLAAQLPVPSPDVSALLLPVSVFSVMSGLLLIVSRRTAIMQVIGYLVLDNGIYLFGWAFVIEEPVLVEMGALLDIFVAVFVMGITIHQLSREFDSIDTDDWAAVKD